MKTPHMDKQNENFAQYFLSYELAQFAKSMIKTPMGFYVVICGMEVI